ncbi:RICIN domain-containing protein [Leifsonia sp. 2TAF2]|uniref:RICIN domain-containing protein n=1 Tax=Leifsonia sp. 2TAF2 TaxID=3233009 RepID=UPI003F9B4317
MSETRSIRRAIRIPDRGSHPPTPRRGAFRTVVAAATGAALVVGGGALAAVPADAAPTAANTLVVQADQPFRPVSHVATGSLYGLANATTPSDALVQAIKPNTFVMMPIGGHQQGSGDIGQTWQKANAAGAKVVDRLSDYYAGWPYQFSWSSWDQVVTTQIQQVKASGMTNLAAYAPWNESDNTWLASNGTFEDFWTHTYRLIRSLDATTPIQGPSFSDNIGDMQNFLQNAVATDTVPDVMAWHELISSSKIAGDVARVEAMEDALGIQRRPIDIEEYAAPAEVGIPGSLVGYISKFERLGIRNAELAFWNQSGALGDLLTGQGGKPNGAYWLYTWYAGMNGDMVTTTPPGNNNFDAAASVSSDKKEVDVITGGTSGAAGIRVAGLDKLQLGSKVNVKVEFTPSYGRTTAVTGPTTISTTNYQVGDDGSITVPVVMNPAYGYHIVVTPAGDSVDLSGTYTISNVNSGLALDTQSSGTASGTAAVQNTAAAGGSATQTWKLVSAGSGLYKVVNPASGLALGIQGASTATGAPAVIWGDGGTDEQLWQVVPDGKGDYRFANYGTGLVLSVAGMSKAAGAGVVQWTDGSVTSGCTATGPRQPGKIGSALSFCNSTAYATLPTGAVSGLTGDYTVSAWVNPASNSTWQRLFDIGSSSNASMFLTLNDGTELRYAITTSGGGGEQRLNSASKTLPLNQWSLVTVTVAGTTGTLYVNGQVVATNASMTVHPSAFGQSTRNYIGKSQYSGDPALNAAVDDLNIYSRALSAAEVAALASGQAGSGDVVHYAFDEAGGTTLVDSSGSGRTGTVVAGSSATTNTSATDAQTADHFWTLHQVTASAAPSAVAATADASAVTVTWSAPSDDGGTPITGYRVYREGVTDPVATVAADATSATITGVWPGDTARFAVAAVNAAGESAKSELSAPVTVPDGSTSKPGKAVLSNDNGWDTGLKDGDYNVVMNLWWGEEGSIYRLYENGALVATKQVTFGGVGAQQVSIPVHGKSDGTYVYTGELVNSTGTTATTSTTVTVTQAAPGTPVLSNDNRGGGGSYTVTANMWWGTNATSYTFYENGVAVGQGSLVAQTPGAQSATLAVQGKATGTYVYRVDFTNAAGTTSSKTMTVTVTK